MSQKSRRPCLASQGLIAAALLILPDVALCQSARDFFRSASVSMIVGSGAGGGYDIIGRLVAHHMSRFLPGNPTIVVKNMPGAAGVQSANFVYNTVPKNGSVILAAQNSSLFLPIYNSSVAHYDPRKFEWIGSAGKQQAICAMWHTSSTRSLDDAVKREVPVSATGVTAGPGVYPKILNTLFGTKFKVISGYDTGGMRLALEKGEVEGICGLAWQTYKVIAPDWIDQKKIRPIAQMGLEKNAELANVPLAIDLLRNHDDKEVLELIVLPQEFGRPFVAPPGTPPDRMAIYRQAFQRMLKDEQFLVEAAKQRLSIEPLDDVQVQALLARAYAAPTQIHDRAAVFGAEMN
jgi:tripartite-type tricarboxylate transporter receptor subunit TctC